MAKPIRTEPAHIAYADDSHRDFNEQRALRDEVRRPRVQVSGPWLSNEVLNRLPQSRRDFDLSRDPHFRKQILDRAAAEAERQGDGTGRGSEMVKRDKPNAVLHPPEEFRRPVDRAAFRANWLAEQRDAAIANAADPKPRQQKHDLPRARQAPERSR